jgi:hypothetical protein
MVLPNTSIIEVEIALKIIMNTNAFVENEQWNVMLMKEEFHLQFAIIL